MPFSAGKAYYASSTLASRIGFIGPSSNKPGNGIRTVVNAEVSVFALATAVLFFAHQLTPLAIARCDRPAL
jgi:hypothetical protein